MKDRTKWLYFWIGYVLSMLEFGLVFSFGALFPDMRDKFEIDRTTTVSVHSILIGTATCFCVISGILINRFGLHIAALLSSICVCSGFVLSFFVTKIWHLYLTLSLLAGVGMSLIQVITITIVATIKDRKQKSLGIAIHSTNIPVAGFIYPYLLDFLTSIYDLSGTFLILGGVFCNSFVFTLMVWLRRNEFITHDYKSTTKVNKENTDLTKENSRGKQVHVHTNLKYFLKKLITVRFLCLLTATAFAISSSNGYLEFVYDISDWKGYSESQTRNIFVILNAFRLFFSISPAILKQKLEIDMYYYPFGLALLGLAGSFVIRFSNSFIVYAVGTACMGAIPGVLACAFNICTYLIHIEQISVALGLFNTISGLLTAGIGSLYGFITDRTGTYNAVLLTIATAQGISAILFIGDIIIRTCCKKSQTRNSNGYVIEVV